MTVLTDKKSILEALKKGKLRLQGQFLSGSNYTFLAQLTYRSLQFVVVYKPARGEQPLWDFPAGSLAQREVAAYLVSEALGWELVPPTVFRPRAPLGAGSVQQFIDHDPEYHYFRFSEKDKQRLRPAVLFDLLVNNADRKGGHVLRDENDHLWLIDHGLCFHVQSKLRTVIWDFSEEPIPPSLLASLELFVHKLSQERGLQSGLKKLLHPLEIAALEKRARHLLKSGVFPAPHQNYRPFPWPPV